MTRLLVDPALDFPDAPATGPITLTATLLDPGPAVVRTFDIADASTLVDLAAPTATQAWRLTVRRPVTTINRWNIPSTNPGPILIERTVHWTDGDPLAWAALTDVDPVSLTVQASPGPVWEAELADLRAQVAALSPA